jgi:hypothetical protein
MVAIVNPRAALPCHVRLNSSCEIELGDRITGLGMVRFEVAGVFIPVPLLAIMLFQFNWGLVLLSEFIPLTESSPETMVSNTFRGIQSGAFH